MARRRHRPSTPAAPPLSGNPPTAQLTGRPPPSPPAIRSFFRGAPPNATTISIDGIGDVPSTGVKTVTTEVSTSYHLIARGDGGSADASARVTVNAVQNAVAVTGPMTSNDLTEDEKFKASVQDIFFDYDSYEVRRPTPPGPALSNAAAYLARNTNVKVLIGGYCDERGSNEYNLTLGQSRANSVKTALTQAGICSRSPARGQLWQGKAVLHRIHRRVLAAELVACRIHD